MQRAILGVCLFVIGCFQTLAGYNVEVTTVRDFRKGIKSVAVLPADCVADVDCLWVEAKLTEHLSKYKSLVFVPPSRVKQVMLEKGISKLDETGRRKLATALEVQAFLVPIVGVAKSVDGVLSYGPAFQAPHSGGMVLTPPDGSPPGVVRDFVDGPPLPPASATDATTAYVALLLVAADSGQVLLEGHGVGRSMWRTHKGTVVQIFREVLNKAMGNDVAR